jgi:hypothetical protein
MASYKEQYYTLSEEEIQDLIAKAKKRQRESSERTC